MSWLRRLSVRYDTPARDLFHVAHRTLHQLLPAAEPLTWAPRAVAETPWPDVAAYLSQEDPTIRCAISGS